MPWNKPTQIKSWSYSRYSTYAQCPYKAKLLYIDKLPMTRNDAMIRGDAIHKLAEKFLKGELPRLPAELKNFAEDFKELKALRKKKPEMISIEETWAMRSDWSETVWDDWAGCWLRIKTDVSHLTEEDNAPVCVITDYKTGKFRPDDQTNYLEQLELYALGGLLKYKHLLGAGLVIKPRLVYIDAEVIFPRVKHEARHFTGADLVPLKKSWEKRVKPMLNDTKFAPKPSYLCKWCDFSAAKGGPCKY
ncbi:PD-(D/E)XK nuclease superfamily [uncultured Caudovirales phage]|uniref:PD-(D/E)XK nuclease superfamily n=1 Tax=uncultured Caudovirales phage TaxID=2100421 RepID=A0A6J5MC07_9CAUD|nr:PD-(D/E)XK nuclease superfamily [uncultured Caudovirales phage]CAB4211875.1 PD-(D/E)XK nuclease superfamily [uncultured Caudovirales phage]